MRPMPPFCYLPPLPAPPPQFSIEDFGEDISSRRP